MNREEVTNSQDDKAAKIAVEWWYSLSNKKRRNAEANPEFGIDAYSDGVLYGWNNPNWTSVKNKLPELNTAPLVRMDLSDKFGEETIIYDVVVYDSNGFHTPYNVTHWMEIQPPRKED